MMPVIRSRGAKLESRRKCTSLDLIQRSMSDYVIHSTAGMIARRTPMLSRTRASLAPAQPVLCILDNIDPLAKLAAKR